jgi:hypothetical protein
MEPACVANRTLGIQLVVALTQKKSVRADSSRGMQPTKVLRTKKEKSRGGRSADMEYVVIGRSSSAEKMAAANAGYG